MGAGTAKIAVVGAGLIGRKHLDVVRAEARLAAVIDPNPEAETLAKDHGAPWFSSLEDCLSEITPDGAIIATPNPLHAANGTTCLEAGIPALIEKPLTASVDEGRALVELETATGTPILVGHHRRHSPIAKEAKALIETGRLGRIVSVNAMFWLHKPADYFAADWRTKAGGGPTYINLIHDIDMLQHLCGPITSVQAREANAVRGFEVEDTSAVILEFASGALGTVSITDTASAPWSWELTAGENPAYPKTDEACYRIGGTQGALSVPDMALWTHEGEQSWWSPIEREGLDLTPADPIVEQFRHFLEVIDGTRPLVRAAEGLRNIEVLEAIKQAAGSGGVVTI